MNAVKLGHAAPLYDTTIGFSDSKLHKFWGDYNWCDSNDYSIREPDYLPVNRIFNAVHKNQNSGSSRSLILRQRSSGESPIKGEATKRQSSVHTNTGWTERAAHKNRLCLERRSGKRTRSSETAAESVRDERAGCGWCCLSDRWDLSIQMTSWELESDRVPFNVSVVDSLFDTFNVRLRYTIPFA